MTRTDRQLLDDSRSTLDRGRSHLAASRLTVDGRCQQLGVTPELLRALAGVDAAADEHGLALAELDRALSEVGLR